MSTGSRATWSGWAYELAHELYPEVAGKQVRAHTMRTTSRTCMRAETAAEELMVSQNPSRWSSGSYGDTVTLVAGDAVKANNVHGHFHQQYKSADNRQTIHIISAPHLRTASRGMLLADFAYTVQAKRQRRRRSKLSGDDTATANSCEIYEDDGRSSSAETANAVQSEVLNWTCRIPVIILLSLDGIIDFRSSGCFS